MKRTLPGTIAFGLTNYWRVAVEYAVGLGIVAGLVGYKLATLLPGYSNAELVSRAQSATLKALRTNPLYGPQKVLQFVLQHFNHHGPLAMRGASALLGILLVIGFYYVMQRWYTTRITVLTTLLFATSGWFLHIARLGITDITMSLLFLLFAAGVWLQQSKTSRLAVFCASVVVVALLYVPGMVWFIVPALIWQRRRIQHTFRYLRIWQLIAILLIGGLAILPLLWALINTAGLYKTWLGLPEHWPTLAQFARNLPHIPSQLVWHGPTDAVRWLDHLALLDWFGIVMFVVGAYAHWFKLHLDRTWTFIYVGIVGSLLISLSGPVTISLFLPFIYVVIGSGVALMLQQWFTVFPRNPFARGLGLSILVLAILTSCFYQVNQYFVAWRNAPETRAVFQQKP